MVQIDFDNENCEYDGDNGDDIDDNENDQKPYKYHGVIVKIYPFFA